MNLEQLCDQFKETIDRRNIDNAQDADELICEFLGRSGHSIDSDEYEIISAALCEIAGKEFPGDWEDYEKEQ